MFFDLYKNLNTDGFSDIYKTVVNTFKDQINKANLSQLANDCLVAQQKIYYGAVCYVTSADASTNATVGNTVAVKALESSLKTQREVCVNFYKSACSAISLFGGNSSSGNQNFDQICNV